MRCKLRPEVSCGRSAADSMIQKSAFCILTPIHNSIDLEHREHNNNANLNVHAAHRLPRKRRASQTTCHDASCTKANDTAAAARTTEKTTTYKSTPTSDRVYIINHNNAILSLLTLGAVSSPMPSELSQKLQRTPQVISDFVSPACVCACVCVCVHAYIYLCV